MSSQHERTDANAKKEPFSTFVKQIGQKLHGRPTPGEDETKAEVAEQPFDPDKTMYGVSAKACRPNAKPTIPEAAFGSASTLPLADVLDSPFQPRRRALTKKDVAELMTSIAAVGQLTPILAAPVEGQHGKFYVHAGHRRCAALRFLGATTVLATVRTDMTERDARKTALADNLGREDLSAIEQAIAIRDFAKAFELPFETAAKDLGVQERTAFRLKAILGASESLQKVLSENAIPAKPADVLARLEASSPKKALRLAAGYAEGKVSSEELEEALRGTNKTTRHTAAGHRVEFVQNAQVVSLNVRLVRETMGAEERERVRAAVAQLLGHAGISGVEPVTVAQSSSAT